MEEKEIYTQNELRSQAVCVLHKTNMLIQLCDSILPEEEGRKNVSLRFREREKAKRKSLVKNKKSV